MTLDLLTYLSKSEDLYLFEKIFKSKNEVIIELIMSIIAVVDNIEYFPHEVLLSVYQMSIQDITSHSKKAYEHFYDKVIIEYSNVNNIDSVEDL